MLVGGRCRQLRPDDDRVRGSFPRRSWPAAGNHAEHALVRRLHVQHQCADASSGSPVHQRGKQQRADPVLLPAVGHHQTDVACTPLIGAHAVTDNCAQAVSDEQDVRSAARPAQRPQQSAARRRDRSEETEVLASGRQTADELAYLVGIGLARCPQQAGWRNRGSIHELSLAGLAKSVK